MNPDMDRLIDRLYMTVDDRGQGLLLRDLGELLAEDLPALPMYFSVNAAVALKRVKAIQDFPGATRVGTTSRNAHLWDVE